MKKFKIVYEPVLPAQNSNYNDAECKMVNEQIASGWSVVNTFKFSDARIAFVMEKNERDKNVSAIY